MERDEDKNDVTSGADSRITSELYQHLVQDYEETVFRKQLQRKGSAFFKGLVATAVGIIALSDLGKRVLLVLDIK